jgi:hypothetical protein
VQAAAGDDGGTVELVMRTKMMSANHSRSSNGSPSQNHYEHSLALSSEMKWGTVVDEFMELSQAMRRTLDVFIV